MEIPPLSRYSLLLASASLSFFFVWRRQRKMGLPLPLGPLALPLLENLLQLGKRPHESLYALSLKYGPFMTLHLSIKTTVVVSSTAMAKVVFKTHDHILAGRTVIEASKSLSHHMFSFICGEYGPHWRNLRRISTVELFSPKRTEALQHLRRDQVFRTVGLIFEERGKVIDIGHTVFCMSLNMLGNVIFSTNVYDPHDPASTRFNHSVCELMKLGRTPNFSAFFPFLRFLDPQGVCRQTAKHMQGMYDFFDSFIQKRLAPTSKIFEKTNARKDFLDVLLDRRSEDFTLVDIRVLLSEFFIAGSETTTTTIEWVHGRIHSQSSEIE